MILYDILKQYTTIVDKMKIFEIFSFMVAKLNFSLEATTKNGE